jgi:hypothetical protein
MDVCAPIQRAITVSTAVFTVFTWVTGVLITAFTGVLQNVQCAGDVSRDAHNKLNATFILRLPPLYATLSDGLVDGCHEFDPFFVCTGGQTSDCADSS